MIFIAALVLLFGVIAAIVVAGFYVLMFVVGVAFLVLVAISFGIGNVWDLDPKSVMWLGLVPLTILALFVWGYIGSRREEEQRAREEAERESERQRKFQARQGSVWSRLRRRFDCRDANHQESRSKISPQD